MIMPLVDIDSIKVRSKRLRVTSDVSDLEKSIRELGLLHPIVVNKKNELLAGARRFKACKQLGMIKVPCVILDLSDLDQELVTIDENLCRLEVRGVEWEDQIARRKEIYELKYPETKKSMGMAKKLSAISAPSFSKDTASRTGAAERTIQAAVKRATDAAPKVKEARKQGKIGSVHVDALVSLSKTEQEKILPVIQGRLGSETKAIVQRVKSQGIASVLKEEAEMTSIINDFNICLGRAKSLKNILSSLVIGKLQYPSSEGVKLMHALAEIHSLIDQFFKIQKGK